MMEKIILLSGYFAARDLLDGMQFIGGSAGNVEHALKMLAEASPASNQIIIRRVTASGLDEKDAVPIRHQFQGTASAEREFKALVSESPDAIKTDLPSGAFSVKDGYKPLHETDALAVFDAGFMVAEHLRRFQGLGEVEYFLIAGGRAEANYNLVKEARRIPYSPVKRVMLSPNPTIKGYDSSTWSRLLDFIDVLRVNDEEMKVATRKAGVDFSLDLFKKMEAKNRNAHALIETSEEGSVSYARKSKKQIVERVVTHDVVKGVNVNTQGCGDMFDAGWVYADVQGSGLREADLFGNVLAYYGVQDSTQRGRTGPRASARITPDKFKSIYGKMRVKESVFDG